MIKLSHKEFKKEIIEPFLEKIMGDPNDHCQECGVGQPEANKLLFNLLDKFLIKKGFISL